MRGGTGQAAAAAAEEGVIKAHEARAKMRADGQRLRNDTGETLRSRGEEQSAQGKHIAATPDQAHTRGHAAGSHLGGSGGQNATGARIREEVDTALTGLEANEAINRANVPLQEKFHTGVLRDLRNISDTP